jgi:hypothetical protein
LGAFEVLRMELKIFLASWRLGDLNREMDLGRRGGSPLWDFPGELDGVFLGKYWGLEEEGINGDRLIKFGLDNAERNEGGTFPIFASSFFFFVQTIIAAGFRVFTLFFYDRFFIFESFYDEILHCYFFIFKINF